MTDQQRGSSGYRGALPPRNDRLGRPWVVVVITLFLLMFVLAIAGLPSGLVPDETPSPLPSLVASPSVSASTEIVSPAPTQ